MRASTLIGKSVRGNDGKNVGQIRDLMVNMNTGDVHYAMLEFDAGIFKPEQLFEVPIKELRMAADGDDLSYNMSKERLERVSVNRGDWKQRWAIAAISTRSTRPTVSRSPRARPVRFVPAISSGRTS
ncbi:MAG: PRC-barrel domain-containing protein [Variovorax sp.]